MRKTIFTLIEKCVACKSCEIACAVEHSPTKTLFGALANPRVRQRVRVENVGAFSYPSRCQHCRRRLALLPAPRVQWRATPSPGPSLPTPINALAAGCAMVCPFGGVSADPVGKKAIKCDRCPDRTSAGSDPACVSACPTKALLYLTPEEMSARQRRTTALSAVGISPAPAAPGAELWRSLRGDA